MKEDIGKDFIGFYNDDDSIYFINGVLEASAFSYNATNPSEIKLSKEETYKVYQIMRKHFEKTED